MKKIRIIKLTSMRLQIKGEKEILDQIEGYM